MSWLSGLAGRAESLLNTLDQSAAEALNKVSVEKARQPESYKKDSKIIQRNAENMYSKNDINKLKGVTCLEGNPPHKLIKINRTGLTSFQDDMKRDTFSDKGSSGYKSNYEDTFSDKGEENIEEKGINIENKLLQSDISSLNKEISVLLQRNHKFEEETKRLRNQLEKVSRQLKEVNTNMRDVSSIEDELREMLKEKDNQIALLSSRLNSNNYSTGETINVNDQINKISILNQELKNKSESPDKFEKNVLDLQMEADDAKIKLAQTVNYYEKIQGELRKKMGMMSAQHIVAKQKTDSIEKELRDYKNKATQILQMKEKLIASLRGAGMNYDNQLSSVGNSENLHQLNYTLCQENDQLREELAKLRIELENKDLDLQEQEQHMYNTTESLRKNVELFEEQLVHERHLKEGIDCDLRQLSQENRQLQEKYLREKADFQNHLTTKEKEFDKLKLMICTKQMGDTDQVVELNARIRSLTDTLIKKQSTLEAAKASKYSLQIRLERVEDELNTLKQTSSETEDEHRISAGGEFVSISMRDAPMSRNFKTAVSTVDKISVRFGVFLRRYPPARLFFLFYILILHFWVLTLLLTNQPELHSIVPEPRIPNS